MQRIPEPELMTDTQQAKAYALADFNEPHGNFIRHIQEKFPTITGNALDIGCGPGDVTFRFARAYPKTRLIGIDGSKAMLDIARLESQKNSDFRERIQFIEGCIPDALVPSVHYEAIIGNSILHQLHSPDALWSYIRKYATAGTRIFQMDLMRPQSETDAKKLMLRYSAGEPEILQRDFYNSLLAAFRPDEILEQLKRAGLQNLNIETVSDRHLIIWGRLT